MRGITAIKRREDEYDISNNLVVNNSESEEVNFVFKLDG